MHQPTLTSLHRLLRPAIRAARWFASGTRAFCLTGGMVIGLGLAAAQAGQSARSNVDGELLVKFRDGSRSAAAERARRDLGHEVRRSFDRFGWQEIKLPSGRSVADALVRYRNHPDVLTVEPNAISTAIDDLPRFLPAAESSSPLSSDWPDDPFFFRQWAAAKIDAPTAWLSQTGSSDVVVAVIDTGVNYFHEDLIGNLWRNPGEIPGNGLDDDGNGWVDDVYGIDTANDPNGNDSDPFDRGASGYYHGSMVAGIIGAVGHNGRGVAGLNWSVRIMAVRAIRGGNLITTGDELEALDYVLVMKRRGVNIRVVNMSYGGLPYSVAERDALAALADAGVLLCAAAGNAGSNNDVTPSYPSSHPLPGIIAVAASDEADLLAVFSQSGSSQYGRTNVDLAAPGLHIASTFGPAANSYDFEFLGTSAATPQVTGAVALLAAANPAATAQQIKAALLESVDVKPAFTNKMVSHGRLNLGRAIDHPFIAGGPPIVARPPESQTVVLSNRVTFAPIVFGARPRALQWLFNGVAIAGATNLNLIVSNAAFPSAGDYSVVVSNALGVTTSQVARLTVIPLLIANHPASQSVQQGKTATLNVGTLGPSPLFYQWHFNGLGLPAATNAELKVASAQMIHDGVYSVTVSNRFGVATSEVATLTVLINPVIVTPPISQSVVQDGSVTFSAGFSGNPSPFGVQWLQGTTARASNTVAGFQDFFTVSNVQTAQAGTWRVQVRNLASSTEVERTFTLGVLADADGDGLPDAWELAHGLRVNDPADALLDADLDGLSNREEYVAGTNPTNALSLLRVLSIERTNEAVALRFSTMANKTYTVQSRTDADSPDWRRVADVMAVATNRVISVVDPAGLPGVETRQYRIVTPRAN